MKFFALFLMLLFLMLTGCTHAISDGSLRLVDSSFNFAMVKENPDKYIGSYVLVGAIASVNNTKQGGELEIVQFRLSSDNTPEESSTSGAVPSAIRKFSRPHYLQGWPPRYHYG